MYLKQYSIPFYTHLGAKRITLKVLRVDFIGPPYSKMPISFVKLATLAIEHVILELEIKCIKFHNFLLQFLMFE